MPGRSAACPGTEPLCAIAVGLRRLLAAGVQKTGWLPKETDLGSGVARTGPSEKRFPASPLDNRCSANHNVGIPEGGWRSAT